MSLQVVWNTVKQWDSVEGLAESVLDYPISGTNDALEAALRAKPSNTAHGSITTRLIVTDADGNEVPFPLQIIVEATFDTEVANA